MVSENDSMEKMLEEQQQIIKLALNRIIPRQIEQPKFCEVIILKIRVISWLSVCVFLKITETFFQRLSIWIGKILGYFVWLGG